MRALAIITVAACSTNMTPQPEPVPVLPSCVPNRDGQITAEELPVVHFREALEIAGAPADEPDLAPAHERAVGAWAKREHGSDLVVVEGYPTANRAFYSHPDPEDPHWSRSFDLLFRGMELVTGGQRLHRPSDYDAAIRARGEDPAAYDSYLQAFRHGMPPHGGFAIGLERWVARTSTGPVIERATCTSIRNEAASAWWTSRTCPGPIRARR